MTMMALRRLARFACLLAASVVVLASCSGDPSVPAPPSADLGTVQNTPVPSDIANLTLTSDSGQVTSLAKMHGEVVVLVDFLTLCQEICPLTTGNLLAMDRAVIAAG